MNRRRSYRSQGYALVEVLAALAIVVMIGTLAFLSFGNNTRQLDADAAKAALFLQEARMRALETGQAIQIVVSAKDSALAAGPRTLMLDPGLDISPERAEIILFPSGSSEGLELVLTKNEKRKIVSLDWLTGAVRVQ